MDSFIRTSTAVTRGQDFSHMLGYPAVINVQVDREEDKGIQASVADMTNTYLNGTYLSLVGLY